MPKMHAQTRRQREVLDFITRYIESHGYRPSYQVIARHMGVSSRAGIGRIVRDLEHQGFLERRRVDGHFAIALTTQNGFSPEGVAIEPLEHSGDTNGDGLSVHGAFILPEFALGGHSPSEIRSYKMPDDSMAGHAICGGDIVLIELRSFARDGDIVAALVGKKQILLRKFFRSGADVELCEADPDARALRLSAEDVEIIGVFKGLIRPIS
jgi:repressor LexA